MTSGPALRFDSSARRPHALQRRTRGRRQLALVLFVGVVLCGGGTGVSQATASSEALDKIHARLFDVATHEVRPFLVVLHEQADLSAAERLYTKEAKGRYVFERLTEVASRTQRDLKEFLDAEGLPYRSFWVANMLWVEGDAASMLRIAERSEVARLEVDAQLDIADLQRTEQSEPSQAPQGMTVEWNVARVGSERVWNDGVDGEGAVVGSMDTGFEWTHPALVRQYRGTTKTLPNHNYNWHDAIHNDRGPCGPDTVEPCDAQGHGTLTMGTSVGDDGFGNQIGVAPGAKWIGCRCWEPTRRTYISYVTECFQWFIAPTDLQGENPDPAMAPHVINNSWICEFDEGCVEANDILTIVENVRAAGIVVVASAGNSGGLGCSTVTDPPAIYEAAFTVGSTNDRDWISPFSSRGPVVRDGSNRMKPDIVAPGENVRSSNLNGSYEGGVSGTSLAGPIVAGVVALMISAVPSLAGDVDAIEQILIDSAVPLSDDNICGGIPNTEHPNHTFGWGMVDAWGAYSLAKARETSIEDPVGDETEATPQHRFRLLPNRPNPFNPSTRIAYEIPRAASVALHIYDAGGRRVRTLVQADTRDAGIYEVEWQGRDDGARAVASGVYFARLESDGRVLASRRLTLVR